MKFKISTHEFGSSGHDAISERITDVKPPRYWTAIVVDIPEDRIFSIDSLAFIEEELTPTIDGQICTVFGTEEGNWKITSAMMFWNADGILTGPGSNHLLGHWIIASIDRRKQKIMILSKYDRRERVEVIERTYPLGGRLKGKMMIAISGRYHISALKHMVADLLKQMQVLQSKGSPIIICDPNQDQT